LDADDFPDLCERFGVESVPYFLFLHDGKVTEAVIGANAPELTLKVKQNALTAAIHGDATVPAMPSQKQSLHARLSALTRRSPVMLFMKGSADAPRCGFSRQIVEILQEEKIQFETFDILTDEEVRQGLKEFSNWPTFPQASQGRKRHCFERSCGPYAS